MAVKCYNQGRQMTHREQKQEHKVYKIDKVYRNDAFDVL